MILSRVTVCFLLFRVFGTCSHPECVVELLLETPFTKKQKERKKERKVFFSFSRGIGLFISFDKLC
jgi:hypothetical protein